ncbi:MAG TPA: polysaccharide export protein EpsE [Steroidobacteraceae bacterium]|nr:polysaccharide export protein EpsE [Steroidobacteraceae bacterium]
MRTRLTQAIVHERKANRLTGGLQPGGRSFSLGVLAALLLFAAALRPAYALEEYLLTPGDVIKVSVFKNPDLTLDARVSEAGTIGFPLLGSVPVAGLTLPAAERKIAQLLKDGGFVLNPQVNILLTTAVGNQVAVLGQVNKPGRYPIEGGGGNLTGMLAQAGGIAQSGADVVIVTGLRNGKPFRREIDVVNMSLSGSAADDIELRGGDTLWVNRSPMFYIYGQVQKPGQYRLEKGMTVMQALADGGGMTGKGTSRGIVLHRRDASGKVKESGASMDEDVHDQDVIYVKESVF